MGRHGSARFRRVILGRPDDLPIAMSHPELELARALEDRDPRWQRQFPIEIPGSHTIHIDVARPDIKLGVEVDGELHDTVVAIHRDKLRDMQAALLGWQILRPTTTDVTEHLMEVISMISRTVTQRTLQFKVA
jgi:very-short-patch-repair endonuclease